MKLSFVLALAGVAMASPVPAIKVVWVTAYETVVETVVGGATTVVPVAENAAAPATTSALEQASTTSLPSTTPTTTPVAETTPETTAAASPTTSLSSSSSASEAAPTGSSSKFAGEGTYYDVGLGACGNTNTDSDYIVAISHILYTPEIIKGNSNNNPLCGRKIRAYYGDNSVDVTVVDQCMGCAEHDLDFSPSAFSQIADKDLGRIDITWEWL